jgi:TonB family protein
MNRLQKKCIIFSVGLHVLLIGILLFGSAFLASEPKNESRPILTAFDPTMVNDLLTKGGNPNVQVAPPTSVPQAAPPQMKPVEAPKPVEPPRPKQVVHEKVETPEPVAKNKISDDEPKPKRRETLSSDELKLTKPRASKPVKNRDREQADSRIKEYADARRAAQNFERSVRNLSKELSTSTAVELPGPGGGGPLSAAYRDIVASTYDAAWSSPPGLNDDMAKVTVSVTIASDGRVVIGRITRPSGNSIMDRSVQNMLDTVTFIQPFPEGSKDRERTFEITLSLRAKH